MLDMLSAGAAQAGVSSNGQGPHQEEHVRPRTRLGRVDQLNDLQNLIAVLEENGDLHRVSHAIDPHLELAGYAAKLEGGPVVLFEKLKGYPYQAIVGLLWNRQVLGRALGLAPRELPFHIADCIASWKKAPIPPVILERGPANHVIEKDVDLYKLPIPKHALKDGGPYLDCSAVIAKDPLTGSRNVSIQRCMVVAKDRMTMLMDAGRHLRAFWERARWQGQSLPITISNGAGLAVYIACCVPAKDAPMFADECGVAGELLGEPLRLIRAQTSDVEAVADAQFVIEGELLPDTFEPEGPFAEVTGMYAQRDNRWVVKVNKITRRRKPIFHTLLSGKEVYNSVGLLGEAAVFRAVSKEVPSVTGVYFTHGGGGFYNAVVAMNKQGDDEPKRAIEATMKAFPPLKIVTVVDDDVNIYDASDVEWAMAQRWRPERGTFMYAEQKGHELNATFPDGVGTKVGFDATCPYPKGERYERIRFLDVEVEAEQ